MGLQQHLPHAGQDAGGGLRPHGRQTTGLVAGQGQGRGAQGLGHGRGMGVFQQVADHHHRIGTEAVELTEAGQGVGRVPLHHRLEQADGGGPVGQAQHVPDHGGGSDLAPVALHDGLVQQGEAVPDRAFRRPGDQGQPLVLHQHAFLGADAGQVGLQHVRLHPPQVEALAAGQDGHRHLADLGGGEDELHMGRRLFQGLEKRVERRRGQHVHFVDHIDLVAGLHGGIAGPVQQLPHLVHLGAAGGVQLQHVHVPPLDDGAAVAAVHRQIDGGAMDGLALEVQGPGQQAGGGGLAHPAHPGEHEGVGDPARSKGMGQGADHGLLADQVLEPTGAVLAGQHLIGGRTFGRRTFGGFGGWRLRRRAAEHVGGGVVALRGGVVRRVGLVLPGRVVGHCPAIAAPPPGHREWTLEDRKDQVETGRRPAAELVTAASFRT